MPCEYERAMSRVMAFNTLSNTKNVCNSTVKPDDANGMIRYFTIGFDVQKGKQQETFASLVEDTQNIDCVMFFRPDEDVVMPLATQIVGVLEDINSASFDEAMEVLANELTHIDPRTRLHRSHKDMPSSSAVVKSLVNVIHDKWDLLHEFTRYSQNQLILLNYPMFDLNARAPQQVNCIRISSYASCVTNTQCVSIELLHVHSPLTYSTQFIHKVDDAINMPCGSVVMQNYGFHFNRVEYALRSLPAAQSDNDYTSTFAFATSIAVSALFVLGAILQITNTNVIQRCRQLFRMRHVPRIDRAYREQIGELEGGRHEYRAAVDYNAAEDSAHILREHIE